MILAWVLSDTCSYLLGEPLGEYHKTEIYILSVFIVSILWYLPRGSHNKHYSTFSKLLYQTLFAVGDGLFRRNIVILCVTIPSVPHKFVKLFSPIIRVCYLLTFRVTVDNQPSFQKGGSPLTVSLVMSALSEDVCVAFSFESSMVYSKWHIKWKLSDKRIKGEL